MKVERIDVWRSMHSPPFTPKVLPHPVHWHLSLHPTPCFDSRQPQIEHEIEHWQHMKSCKAKVEETLVCTYLQALAVELLAFRIAAVASLDVHPCCLLLLLLQPRPIAGDDLGLEGVGLLLYDALCALIHLVGVVLYVAAAQAGAPLVAEHPGLEAMAVAACM